MAHFRKRSNLLLLLPALFLFSCAGIPEPQSQIYENSIFATESSAPGSLLEAEALSVIASGKARQILAITSPRVIGAQIKMDVLEKAGYAAWRASRLNTLSDIRHIRIVFAARSPGGGCERQSGTIFLPAVISGSTRELTWLIVAKGTEMRREFTPSRGKGVEMPFITTAAALGYAVWVPDYSGMGDGRGVHAYCVAESLADSAFDGLAAARQWLRQATENGRRTYRESGRLAIIGYSEGGLTVMGALRAIADKRIPTPGLRLIAVYPMGAPLNLALGVSFLGVKPYVLNHPEYQVFLALGWMRVYPGHFELADVLLTGTIENIVPLFDGTRDGKDLNRKIAKIVGKKVGSVIDSDIFAHEYLSVLRRDPASTAYYRLQEENRLDRWTPPPGIPIIFAAAPTDEVVPFANSSNEYDWARENAPLADVTLVRLASADHLSAGVEAYLFSIVDLEKREATLRTRLD
jgi:pimeloyl-ACP methyl ester carboxylesterase